MAKKLGSVMVFVLGALTVKELKQKKDVKHD